MKNEPSELVARFAPNMSRTLEDYTCFHHRRSTLSRFVTTILRNDASSRVDRSHSRLTGFAQIIHLFSHCLLLQSNKVKLRFRLLWYHKAPRTCAGRWEDHTVIQSPYSSCTSEVWRRTTEAWGRTSKGMELDLYGFHSFSVYWTTLPPQRSYSSKQSHR